MHRACRRSHISRAPFAPLWAAGLIRRPAGAGLLANFNAGSALLCVLRIQVKKFSARRKRPHFKSFISKSVLKDQVCPLSRLQQAKNSYGGGRQSFLRAVLQNLWGGRGCGHARPKLFAIIKNKILMSEY